MKRIIIAIAGIALLASCKGKQGYENEKSLITADTAARTADTATGSKLVKRADISFKVKNVQQTSDSVAKLTSYYNGMVMHHQMNSTISNSSDVKISEDSLMRVSAFNTNADMTVKLPSEKLEEFMSRVSHYGIYVTRQQMDIEDRSFHYISDKLKVQNRQKIIAEQKAGKIKIKSPESSVKLGDDIIDRQINNSYIDDAVKYSTISLNFYQSDTILKEMIANDNPVAYQLPFFKRFAMAFANGWQVFMEVILAIANLWVFILLGVGLFIGYKVYKKKYPSLVKA